MNRIEAINELNKLAEIFSTNPQLKIVKISDTTIKVFERYYSNTGKFEEKTTYYVDVDQQIKAGFGQDEYTYMVKERST